MYFIFLLVILYIICKMKSCFFFGGRFLGWFICWFLCLFLWWFLFLFLCKVDSFFIMLILIKFFFRWFCKSGINLIVCFINIFFLVEVRDIDVYYFLWNKEFCLCEKKVLKICELRVLVILLCSWSVMCFFLIYE